MSSSTTTYSSPSSWIHDGLRILKDYFGEEDEESNNNGATTNETQQPHRPSLSAKQRGAKRKAMGLHVDADTAPPTSTRQQRWKKGVREKVTSSPRGAAAADQEAHATKLVVNNPVVSSTPVVPTEMSARDCDSNFLARLQQLKKFMTKHGHMKVSCTDTETRPLYRWVQLQRRRRRAYPERYQKEMVLSAAERMALDEIGFDWAHRPQQSSLVFGEKLAELQEFQKKHNHMNVRRRDNEDLFRWMDLQRKLGKAFPKPFSHGLSAMTKQEKAALDSIGFVWDAPSSDSIEVTRLVPDHPFWHRFDELKAFIGNHGHMNIPHRKEATGRERSLSKWVGLQRELGTTFPNPRYKGKRAMTQEEKDALDSVGFEWHV